MDVRADGLVLVALLAVVAMTVAAGPGYEIQHRKCAKFQYDGDKLPSAGIRDTAGGNTLYSCIKHKNFPHHNCNS